MILQAENILFKHKAEYAWQNNQLSVDDFWLSYEANFMYKNIVLAYDGSKDGHEALAQGAVLSALCKADVHLVAVITPTSGIDIGNAAYPSGEWFSRETNEIKQLLEEGERQLNDNGLRVKTYLCYGQAVDEINNLAVEVNADLIVVGHREQSALARWWRGSVGNSLLANAPCSILVCVMEH